MKSSVLGRHLKAGRAAAEAHEPALVTAYRSVLGEAARDAATRFETVTVNHLTADATNPKWTPPNDDELIDAEKLAAAARKKTKAAHKAALKAMLKPALDDLDIRFDLANPLIDRTFGKLGVRAQDLDAAIRAQVVNAIRDGYSQGLSIPDVAASIMQAVTDISVGRAELLARTDMIGLVNGGSVAAARLVGVEFKQWLTAEDERVRETHADADGQVVPVDQPFTVGGTSLEYPGDPDGPDDEVFNCRCVTVFVEAEDASGTVDDPVDLAASGTRPSDAVASGGHMSESPSVTDAETLLASMETEALAAAVTVTVDGNDGEGSVGETASDAVRWRSILCVEGVETQDNALFGRMLAEGSVTWRDLPLSLGVMFQTPHSDIATADVGGTIETIYRDVENPSVIWGEGTFNNDDVGRKAVAAIESGSLRGISVDLYVARFDVVPQEGTDVQPGKELMLMTEVVIGAATVVPFQALEDATIAITASADPDHLTSLVADAKIEVLQHTDDLDPRVRDALSRLELASRREVYETYKVGMDIGLLSLNDCLAREGMSPVDGGDEKAVPRALAKERDLVARLNRVAELGDQVKEAIARVEENEARTVALIASLDQLIARFDANQKVNEALVASVREAASLPRTVTFRRDEAGRLIGADES